MSDIPALGASDVHAAIAHLKKGARRSFLGPAELVDLLRDQQRFARRLEWELQQGCFRFEPAEAVELTRDNKTRVVYRSTVVDVVVERVLSRWLTHYLEGSLSPVVHSYRQGCSSATALHAFGRFVRQHRAERPDPRSRGLWVLRRDVSAYGESIPIGGDSALWSLLEAGLATAPPLERERVLQLLRDLLPRRVQQDGEVVRNTVGTPTGSSVQPVLNNLYLTPLDEALAALGFVVRFGDDVLFASPCESTALQAAATAEEVVTGLGLSFGHTKSLDLWFTGSGAACSSEWATGCSQVPLLGSEMCFRARIRLPVGKWRLLLHALERRLRRTLVELRESGIYDGEVQVSVLGQVLSAALDPQHPLAVAQAQALTTVVDDRSQLRALDMWIFARVASLVARRTGPRALRRWPPRRQLELGVPSLVAQRNAIGRR